MTSARRALLRHWTCHRTLNRTRSHAARAKDGPMPRRVLLCGRGRHRSTLAARPLSRAALASVSPTAARLGEGPATTTSLAGAAATNHSGQIVRCCKNRAAELLDHRGDEGGDDEPVLVPA